MTSPMLMQNARSRVLRAFTLLVTLANVFFVAYYPRVSATGQSSGMVTARYDSLVVPPPWAFAMFAVLAVLMLAYCAWQLMPKQAGLRLCDSLSSWLIVANVLTSAWIVAYGHDRLEVSVVLMIGLLATLAAAYAHATIDVRADLVSPWVRVPFAAAFGWMLMMTFQNATAFFVSKGAIIDTSYALIGVALVAIVSLVVAGIAHDAVLPLVSGWSLFSLWDAMYGESNAASMMSFGFAVLSVSAALIIIAWRLRTREDFLRRRHPVLFASWRPLHRVSAHSPRRSSPL